jgi:Cu-Zn family superoxide dismutase
MVVTFVMSGAACGGSKSSSNQGGTQSESAPTLTATATLAPTQGSSVSGTVTFEQTADGVRVFAVLSGLTPGEHGFHVHEIGDCSSPDGSAAGAHFNPAGMAHGGPDADPHHMGDLGNITADSTGHATYDRVDAHLALDGANSIVGRAVIVHEKADDMTSQPAGAAGARLACGVIELR